MRREFFIRRSLIMLATACAAAASVPAFAQSCAIAIDYQSAMSGDISPVPGLGVLGLALLTGVFGVVMWRRQRMRGQGAGGGGIWSATLLAIAGMLGVLGGGGLIQSVRAAGPYEFSDPSGGAVTDDSIAYEQPSPFITITNSSGQRIRISGNANPEETGTCTIGSEVDPGGSCTTQAVCQEPPAQAIAIIEEPVISCDYGTLLYSESWSDYDSQTFKGYSIYAPGIVQSPVFDPSDVGVGISFDYTPGPHLIINQENGEAENLEEAASGIATVIATAPDGYGFGDPPASQKVWTIDYQGCSANSASGS